MGKEGKYDLKLAGPPPVPESSEEEEEDMKGRAPLAKKILVLTCFLSFSFCWREILSPIVWILKFVKRIRLCGSIHFLSVLRSENTPTDLT